MSDLSGAYKNATALSLTSATLGWTEAVPDTTVEIRTLTNGWLVTTNGYKGRASYACVTWTDVLQRVTGAFFETARILAKGDGV